MNPIYALIALRFFAGLCFMATGVGFVAAMFTIKMGEMAPLGIMVLALSAGGCGFMAAHLLTQALDINLWRELWKPHQPRPLDDEPIETGIKNE